MDTSSSLADENIGIELLYRNKSLDNIPFKDIDTYNKHCRDLGLSILQTSVNYNHDYNIPLEYLDIDVEKYVWKLAKSKQRTNAELERVELELQEYKLRNLFPVLRLMIYIIATMRNNNIVWGVGRGSSVASYVLYLIGVHKINSVRYKLNLREFLK